MDARIAARPLAGGRLAVCRISVCLGLLLAGGAVEVPGIGNAFELMSADVLEVNVGSGHEVFDGL